MIHPEKKSLKLLGSYFLTYMAVLLIPIIAAVVYFAEASGAIRTGIENENRVLMQQAADVLDVQMKEMNDFGLQMVSNPAVSSLRSVQKPLEYPYIQSFFQVQNTLPRRSMLNSFLFDYFLFFNQGQMALNDRYAYSYDDFYTLYMHSPDETAEEWKQKEADAPLSIGACGTAHVIYTNGDSPEEKDLVYLAFSFLPYSSRDGRIVLYIDRQKFVDILNTFRLTEGDTAYIESSEGILLACAGKEQQDAENLQAYLAARPQEAEMVRASVSGKDMLISRYQSGQTNLRITIARSADRVYARLNRTRWIIGISLAVAIILGILFSYLFARRNSALLRKLAFGSTAGRISGMSIGEAFRSLRRTFDHILIANDAMEKTLASQQPYLQKAYLTQLLNGEFTSEDNALAIARNISGFHAESPMRVLLLHFSENSAFSGDTMDLQFSVNCKAVIRLAVESAEPDALRMSQSESDYVLLLCGENLEERIGTLVQLIRKNLPEGINECLFAYAGNPVNQLTEVVRSWNNAASMIYIQPSPEEVPVLYYRENENTRFEAFYPQDLQRRLINSMMSADEQQVQEILKILKDENRQDKVIPGYIARLLADSLLNTLLQINTMSGLPAEESQDILSDAQGIMSLPAGAQLDRLDELYSSLCQAIRQMKSGGGKQQVIDEISVYIQEHYMDPDLSLTSVADRFHVSESYLSFAFKAQMGTNFFSFVEDLRISRAKELLRGTGLKISEIASQTGYASANSFCRAFKRHTGESASNYRNGTEEN